MESSSEYHESNKHTSQSGQLFGVKLNKDGHSVRLLDAILLINGIKVYSDTCQAANIALRVVFIAYNYFHLLKNVYAFELNVVNMKKFVYICVHLTAIVSHHSLLLKWSRLKGLLDSTTQLMPQATPSLVFSSRVSVGLWTLGVACGMASGTLRWYRHGTDAFLLEEYLLALSGQYYWLKLAIVALDIVLFNAVSIGWYLATVVFYTHTLYTVSLVQGSLLQADTRWRAQLTDQRNHYRSMRTLWHRVTILRQTFDQVFSLQPFLWFVCLFIECSLTLILFKYDYHRYASQSTLTVVLDNWSLYIMRALFVCGAAVVVDQVNARADTLFSSFSADLLSGDHRHCQLEVFFLLTEVRQTLHMSATCWGMFQLNKSALLVFANSVIPFSVLVLNLADTVNGGQAA